MAMELLTYPRTDYLLDATLATLHTESVAWLSELDFWCDEMTFLYRLIHHRKLSKSLPIAEVAAFDMELVRLNGEVIESLRSDITSHERLLASACTSNSAVEQQVYREAHRVLLGEMHNLQTLIRGFKRKAFIAIEQG